MTDGMRINLKGYVPESGRRGQTRHRVRVEGNPGKRITIPCGPTDPSFMEHYLAARVGQTVEAEPEPTYHERSLDAAVQGYIAHLSKLVADGKWSPLTYKQRKSLLETAVEFQSPEGERMGDLDQDLPTEAFEHIRDQWGAVTAQADNCTKALIQVYKWLKAKPNPVSDVAYVHTAKGGAIPWSADDLRKFMKTHPKGSMAYVWLMLAMFTGARRDDLRKLGRGNEVTRHGITWLEFQPGKKGSAFVSIPMMPLLFESTRAPTVQGKTYLLHSYGKPFKSGDSLGNKVQKWTKQAGMTKRSSHGLRKALATLLAEMGCSSHQIMAVMAHTKASTSEIYTKSAERALMAKSAFEAIKHVKF